VQKDRNFEIRGAAKCRKTGTVETNDATKCRKTRAEKRSAAKLGGEKERST